MISDVGPILHDPRKLLDQYTALPRCKEKRQDANCGVARSGSSFRFASRGVAFDDVGAFKFFSASVGIVAGKYSFRRMANSGSENARLNGTVSQATKFR